MIELYRSDKLKRLGVKHGFSKRGDRGAPFGSLNVKSDPLTPDDPKRTESNRRKILKAAKLDPDRAVFLRTLAHGNTVFEAHNSDSGQEIDGYDAIITNQAGLTISLSVADCVPILLYEPKKNAAAVIHAGWRSTQANVVTETLKELHRHFKVEAENLIAVIGPSICGACFEVGEEVAALFAADVVHKSGSKLTVDLREANQRRLELNGVTKIEDIDLCTHENTDQLFSARKEGQTGRFLAFIAPKTLSSNK